MRKRKRAAAVGLFCASLAFSAGTAGAATIKLRALDADSSYTFTDVIAYERPFSRTVGFDLRSPAASALSAVEWPALPLGRYGVATLPAARERVELAAFAHLAPTGVPAAFDDLLDPVRGAASHAPRDARQGSLQTVRESNVWVMLLVGLGVVLHQLRRKQRALEQDPVAA